MIAHEIRTPVSLIIGPLEKLMKVGSPTDDLRVINRNAHRLLELVNQLLDFRKVEKQSLVKMQLKMYEKHLESSIIIRMQLEKSVKYH